MPLTIKMRTGCKKTNHKSVDCACGAAAYRKDGLADQGTIHYIRSMKPVTAMTGIRVIHPPSLSAIGGRMSGDLLTGVVSFIGILGLIVDSSLSGAPVEQVVTTAADLVVKTLAHCLRLS
ncbi:MAG: hypothetical protein OXC54_02705 [Rhodospirillaceae bacterium]|nr:hypothetical protein [Rhodospirillaceae bacterium]